MGGQNGAPRASRGDGAGTPVLWTGGCPSLCQVRRIVVMRIVLVDGVTLTVQFSKQSLQMIAKYIDPKKVLHSKQKPRQNSTT